MNKRKTKGGFAKVLRLASVLQKCNGKSTLGDSNALISPKAAKAFGYIGLILLTVLLIVGLWFLEPVVALIIPIPSIVQTLMMILFLLSFYLGSKLGKQHLVIQVYTNQHRNNNEDNRAAHKRFFGMRISVFNNMQLCRLSNL